MLEGLGDDCCRCRQRVRLAGWDVVPMPQIHPRGSGVDTWLQRGPRAAPPLTGHLYLKARYRVTGATALRGYSRKHRPTEQITGTSGSLLTPLLPAIPAAV